MTIAQRLLELVDQELVACGGNISEAARRLGVHRRTLQRWLAGKASASSGVSTRVPRTPRTSG